jgi:broad specificity phosphatase PhoE
MQIIFVRHGETDHNNAMVITSGNPGGGLTENGVAQIRRTVELVRPANPVALYSSPLRRARQSADILAEGLGLPVVDEYDLRECDVGALEGSSDESSFARFNESMDRWYVEADLDFPLGPEGETARAAIDRAGAVVVRIAAAHPGDVSVVVVCHQTLLQLILTYVSQNLPPLFGHRRWMANGGTSLLDVTPDRTVCLEWDARPVDELLAELKP